MKQLDAFVSFIWNVRESVRRRNLSKIIMRIRLFFA